MSTNRWTADDIPPQSGKIHVITGSNTGLGLASAMALAERGAHVVLACRSLDKAEQAASAIRAAHPDAAVDVAELDLGSLDAIREQSAAIAERFPKIDVLMNNAGVMHPPKSTTTDGFELQFGTNHLGHFLLTSRLLPTLRAAPGSRVVTVASIAHAQGGDIHFDDLQWERMRYSRQRSYAQSKLANLIFARELDRRLQAAGIDAPISVAAHPGVAATELSRHLPFPVNRAFNLVRFTPFAQAPDKGALSQLKAAVDPEVKAGEYWGPNGPFGMSGYPAHAGSTGKSKDLDIARRLWEVSEQLTGEVYDFS